MQIAGAQSIFFFGCLGGLCLELLRWWKLRESLDFPAYSRRPVYWALTVAMILAGGLIAVAYGAGPTNALQAMNIGAAAPAIIGALASPPKDPGLPGGHRFAGPGDLSNVNRLRRFLSFG